MFPWSIIGTALKTGAEIYKNKKKSEIIMSEARIVHAEKMKRGEIEYVRTDCSKSKKRLEGRICTFSVDIAAGYFILFRIC
jgi:hypothetical protein